MIDGLAGVEDNGIVLYVCAKCRIFPSYAYGAVDPANLVHMFVCPKGANPWGMGFRRGPRERAESLRTPGRAPRTAPCRWIDCSPAAYLS